MKHTTLSVERQGGGVRRPVVFGVYEGPHEKTENWQA